MLYSPCTITPPPPVPGMPHPSLPFCFSISIHTELLTTSLGQIHPAYAALFLCVSVTEPLQLSAHFEMFYASKGTSRQNSSPKKNITQGALCARLSGADTYLRAPV